MKLSKSSLLIIFCCSFLLVFIGVKMVKDLKANTLIEEANELIRQNRIDDALLKVDQAKEILASKTNQATLLEEEIKRSQSDEYAKQAITNLFDNEYFDLKNGTLQKTYIKNEYLNVQFIEKLKSLSSQRKKFVDEALAQKALDTKERNKVRRIGQIKESFNTVDGSHFGLVSYMKKGMHDSRSFEHVETTYMDSGDDIKVTMKFRGKNILGNLVLQTVEAKCSVEGEVIEIEIW